MSLDKTSASALSDDLHARAARVLAGGVSSSFRTGDILRLPFIERAAGAELFDVDGRRFIDFVCGYGPIILGHADPFVSEAVARVAQQPQQTGARTRQEVELAEQLCEVVPAFAQLRFASSGSEAVQAAVRTARTATSRSLILMFTGHYHGWLDGLFRGTHARPSDGIPDSACSAYLAISWNDFDAVRDAFTHAGEEIAAVLMEPLPCNAGILAPRPGFLEYVRDLAHSSGALVIFDEVITGFRVDVTGVQGVSGVTPDLAIVSKAMANGYPISAFGGTQDVMRVVENRRTIHGGTFNGGGVSVAAGSATIKRLTDLGSPLYERLTVLGQQLMKGLCSSGARAGVSVEVAGPGPVFHVWFSDTPVVDYSDHLSSDREKYARFAAKLFECGVWVLPSGRWHLSAAHRTDHVSETLEAIDSAFQLLADAS